MALRLTSCDTSCPRVLRHVFAFNSFYLFPSCDSGEKFLRNLAPLLTSVQRFAIDSVKSLSYRKEISFLLPHQMKNPRPGWFPSPFWLRKRRIHLGTIRKRFQTDHTGPGRLLSSDPQGASRAQNCRDTRNRKEAYPLPCRHTPILPRWRADIPGPFFCSSISRIPPHLATLHRQPGDSPLG